MTDPLQSIRIGTLVPGHRAPTYIRQILAHGFESFSLTWGWGKDIRTWGDLARTAADTTEALRGSGAVVSSLSFFGNPLLHDDEGDLARRSLAELIVRAKDFGCGIVTGFAGAQPDRPVDQNIPRFAEVWGRLADLAATHGVRLAFENCPMGGTWRSPRYNIAFNPDAWELMFAALPQAPLGLQWEPCHQMCQLIDPMPQVRAWVGRFVCLHGKDATILRDELARHGCEGAKPWAFHRHPGFGDSDWTAIISELRRGGFTGAIDIEGWHDPVYRGELEMTGQVAALHHLKRCRGGTFVANPS